MQRLITVAVALAALVVTALPQTLLAAPPTPAQATEPAVSPTAASKPNQDLPAEHVVDRAVVYLTATDESSKSPQERLINKLFLDLTGRPPKAEELKKYVSLSEKQTKRILIDKLLNTPNHCPSLWLRSAQTKTDAAQPYQSFVTSALVGANQCTQCHQPHNKFARDHATISLTNVVAKQALANADLQRLTHDRESMIARLTEWTFAEQQADKPWIGVAVGPLDDVLKAQLNVKTGVVVTKVAEKSPAEQAGVTLHDVLLTVNDAPIGSGADLDKVVHQAKGDDKPLVLVMVHTGQQVVRRIKPQQPIGQAIDRLLTEAGVVRYRIGVAINDVDDTLRAHLKLDESQGVVVMEVIKDTPAEKVGFKKLDVITQVNDKPVRGMKDLIDRVQESTGQPLNVELHRSGKRIKLLVTPKKEIDEALKQRILKELSAHTKVEYEYSLIHPGVVVTDKSHSLNERMQVGGGAESKVRWATELGPQIIIRDLDGSTQSKQSGGKKKSSSQQDAFQRWFHAATDDKRQPFVGWFDGKQLHLVDPQTGAKLRANSLTLTAPKVKPDDTKKQLDQLTKQLAELTKAVQQLQKSVDASNAQPPARRQP